MKTTIDIPDALAREAKELAHRQRSSLRDLVVSGLRAEVDRRRASAVVDFHFPTTAGQGLAVGVDQREVVERSYEPLP